ncbi:MAG: LysR family transcriptional regulator, partial [Rhizobium oryzihabitans]
PAGLKEIAADVLPALEDVEFVLQPSKGTDTKLVRALSDLVSSKSIAPGSFV